MTNRPTENLRIRTDVLRYDLEAARLALGSVVFFADDGAGTPTALDVHWDGPYDPTGSSVPAVQSTGSGCLWIGSGISIHPNARLVFQPANSPPSLQKATAAVTYTGGLILTFTADTTAARGANSLRVRIFSQTGPSDLTGLTKVAVSWTHPLPALADQSYSPSTYPYAAPTPPGTNPSTLNIQVRSDGTTLISDIKTALASAYPGTYKNTSGSTVPANTGAMLVLTANQSDGYAVPATVTGGASDTGYVMVQGGADPVRWAVSAATLQAFFDSGLVNTSTLGAITSTGLQSVQVAASTNISVGTVLDFDSGGSYEQVTVTAVNNGVSPPTISAVFTKTHLTAAPVKARPNGIRSGDTVALSLGDGKDRLKVGTVSQSNLVNLRIGGLAQEALVLPVAVCPAGFTRVLIAGLFGIFEGGRFSAAGGTVQLGGDLLGPGSTSDVPKVVLADNSSPGLVTLGGDLAGPSSSSAAPKVVLATGSVAGLVKLAGDLAGPASASAAPTVVRGTTTVSGVSKLHQASLTPSDPVVLSDGDLNTAGGVAALDGSRVVLGTGVARDTAGTLSIGTSSNDTAITIGKTGQTTTMPGALSVTQAATFSAGASMNSQKVTSLADPTSAQDGATKAYVDPHSAISPDSGSFSTNSVGGVSVANLTVTITCRSGRPVLISMQPSLINAAFIKMNAGGTSYGHVSLYRGATDLADWTIGPGQEQVPVSLTYVDTGATPGSVTYSIQISVANGADTISGAGYQLLAVEL